MSLFDFFKKNKYKFNGEEKKPIKEEEIERVEQQNNIKFPLVLRNYWLMFGDAPIKSGDYSSEKFKSDVRTICFPSEKLLKLGKENGWLQDNFYPIARDSGGNYYSWNSVNDKVYLAFDDSIDNPFVVASSVKEFFNVMEKCVK